MTQDIENSFSAKKRAGAVFTYLQQHTTLYGFAASLASYCSCYLTGTWSA